MAPETLVKIFEPFFTTKPVDKGTGLGLSQVYGFAKQSGGEINAESVLGSGTTFTLYLPRSTAQATPSRLPEKEGIAPGLPTRRILLVEDNEAVGAFAADLLKELGQAVMWVGDGQSALDMLRQDGADYDLVFSDVVMPGISGIELARQIAAEWPNLEVVLTSGYSHVLAEEGSFGFELLKKPYSIDGLLKALRQDRPT
jgi:CheY-like chemotaxis protein